MVSWHVQQSEREITVDRAARLPIERRHCESLSFRDMLWWNVTIQELCPPPVFLDSDFFPIGQPLVLIAIVLISVVLIGDVVFLKVCHCPTYRSCNFYSIFLKLPFLDAQKVLSFDITHSIATAQSAWICNGVNGIGGYEVMKNGGFQALNARNIPMYWDLAEDVTVVSRSNSSHYTDLGRASQR